MIKTILMILILALMLIDLIIVIFSKHLVRDLKSQDIYKRIKAENLHGKLSLISYLAFFGLLIILVIITKLL